MAAVIAIRPHKRTTKNGRVNVPGYGRRRPKKLKKYVAIEKEAKARAKGEEIGKLQAHKKKPLEESLREHFGKMVDRIEPFKALAYISLTYLVHQTITNTEELKKVALGIVYAPLDIAAQGFDIVVKPIQEWLGWPTQGEPIIKKTEGYKIFVEQTGAERKPFQEIGESVVNILKNYNTNPDAKIEIGLWILSFAIAYVIVEHGGQIAIALGTATSSLINMVKFFLPVGT